MWPFKKVTDITKVRCRIRQVLGENSFIEVIKKLSLVDSIMRIETIPYWWGQYIYKIELTLSKGRKHHDALFLAKLFHNGVFLEFVAGGKVFSTDEVLEYYKKNSPDFFDQVSTTIHVHSPDWKTARFNTLTGTMTEVPRTKALVFTDKEEDDAHRSD